MSRPPAVSFEFFPPKTAEQATMLDAAFARLSRFRPHYVSVTYGAGGTSQERSIETVARLATGPIPVAAHLTCAGASRTAVRAAIRAFRAAGIERFVALRGDPPGGLSEPYRPHPEGYRDTADLVRALKDAGAAEVSVSAYPERHPQSPDWDTEIATLKRKVDAGADRAITQFFFEIDRYEAYVERVRRAGIGVPIDPGIMPIHRFASVCTFAGRCGASIPEKLARRFDGLDPDSHAHAVVATAVAAEQVADLLRRGVEAFHIYALNRAELAEAICRVCGVLPDEERVAARARPTSDCPPAEPATRSKNSDNDSSEKEERGAHGDQVKGLYEGHRGGPPAASCGAY
jgi:methylenetetrahydrofolate reductase (NADPH)